MNCHFCISKNSNFRDDTDQQIARMQKFEYFADIKFPGIVPSGGYTGSRPNETIQIFLYTTLNCAIFSLNLFLVQK